MSASGHKETKLSQSIQEKDLGNPCPRLPLQGETWLLNLDCRIPYVEGLAALESFHFVSFLNAARVNAFVVHTIGVQLRLAGIETGLSCVFTGVHCMPATASAEKQDHCGPWLCPLCR